MNPKKLPLDETGNAWHQIMTPRSCRYGALAFFAVLILVGAIPGKAEALSAVFYDKVLHFVAYASLSALVYGAIPGTPTVRAIRTLLIIGTLGAADEAIQSLLPYRSANAVDWVVDMIAAVASVSILSRFQQPRRRYARAAHPARGSKSKPASNT